jgi:integrase
MEKFTREFIESLQPDGRDRIIFDATKPGFGIRITAAGKRLYIARARVGGKQRYANIGDVDELKLKEARQEADRALNALKNGRDPAQERRERARVIEAGGTTIDQLATRWMAEIVNPKRKPRTAEDYQRLIDQRIGPEFGHLPVNAIEREQVIRWHASMRKTPRRANYAVATFKALLNFAEDVGLRAPHTNPCRRIEFYREKGRERFLSEPEIAKAADAIRQAERKGKIGPHAAAGLRLALFTGARSGEITAAKWEHVDFERKLIRLPDSKTNEPRTIHLSDAALDVLKTIPRVPPYVIAGALKSEPFKNLGRSWIVARAYGGLQDVRLHDLRHSYASLAASKGVSLQMIGKLLGHKVAATTQRYAHLARDAAAAVNDALGAAMVAAIQKPRSGGNVVRLRRRRAKAR